MNYTQVKLPTTAVERDEALLPDWTGGVVTLGTTHYRRKGGGGQRGLLQSQVNSPGGEA